MIILKMLPVLIFWLIFGYVVLMISYPETLTQANIIQLLYFFIPLFLALTFTINLILKFAVRSVLITLTLITFLILNALGILNLVTFVLTPFAFGLFISYFKKKSNLTSNLKIRKLTHK